MKLKRLTVGPIVGETTANSVRVWGRGKAEIEDNRPRRCFGALRYRIQGNSVWSDPQIFKMNPNFDMTGISILDRLKSETSYEYQMGYFFSDGDFEDVHFIASNWSEANDGHFLTASNDDRKPRTLVIGSCRYILRTFFGEFFDDRGDKTFRSILRKIEKGQEIHQLIMMGDQIYADDLNQFNPDKTVDQFFSRYRSAFSQPYLRQLMSQVPTYMTLDDHEIEDNWPEEASEKDWKTLFPVAIHAYQAYQLSHSPNLPILRRRLIGTPKRLWYKYTDGCCDVFVTDSRTERFINPDGNREILGQEQMRLLKRWLGDESGRVKIIVTSVPFVPDSRSDESKDKWSGFESQRIELLEYIQSNQVQRVVFFSGDIHASLSVELVSATDLKIFSVISSAFFWPYPHPSIRHYRTSGTIDGGRAGDFKLTNASRVINDDNFSVVDIDLKKIKVEVYGRKGKRMSTKTYRF